MGEFDKNERHMSFPRIDCPLRTDQSFRESLDPDHHNKSTPLLELPIDMVKDIIIADSLHLIDLGRVINIYSPLNLFKSYYILQELFENV